MGQQATVALRRKLYSLGLKKGDSVQRHLRAMIEIFDALGLRLHHMDVTTTFLNGNRQEEVYCK